MIIKYNEDGSGYSVVPTQRINIKGVNGLIAMVQSFSGYGVKTVTQEEIDKMGDETISTGLDWTLKVDDEFKNEIIGEGDIEGGLTFISNLLLSMENTQRKDSWMMHGTYTGEAHLAIGVDIYLEGEIYNSSNFTGDVQNESFVLYPVPTVYDTGGDGLPLVGLVPEYYMGAGILHLKWSHVPSQKGAMDIVDVAGMMGTPMDITEKDVAFTVITNGPYAEVELLDFSMYGSVVHKGIIVGHGKDTPKESDSVPLEDLAARYREKMAREAQIKSNSDGSVSIDKNGDGKDTITINISEDSSLRYDTNGDGVYDIEIAPLEVKR